MFGMSGGVEKKGCGLGAAEHVLGVRGVAGGRVRDVLGGRRWGGVD